MQPRQPNDPPPTIDHRVPNDAMEPTLSLAEGTPDAHSLVVVTPSSAPDVTEASAVRRIGPPPGPGRLGEYELLQEIARGGMGVVYKARHTRLNRVVALKMILAGQLAGSDEIRRFHAEARAAAGLDHPGIVPVYEFGEIDGRPFFSMGYVDGPSLAIVLREGPLLAREAAELVRQISLAVQYAHERGVIHRDLKPGNVLLERVPEQASSRPGSTGAPARSASGSSHPSAPLLLNAYRAIRVTDFGLAKQTQGDSDLTATGQILGTPSYMPPEQASGRHDQVGVTSDVYSLGAILYATLTARPPFQAASIAETLRQAVERDPVPPRTLNPSVPRDLETIVLKCLRKSPGDRYPSAAGLAEELRRFLAGEPIVARPAGPWERTVRWCRRQPVAASLAAVATLLTALLAIGGPVVAWREVSLRQAADEGKNQAVRQTNLAQQRAGQLQQATQKLQQQATELAAQVVRANDATQQAEEASQLRAAELARAESALLVTRLQQAQLSWQQRDPALAMEQLEQCPEGLRNWEWHYLARQCQRLKLRANHPECDELTFLPDGERILTSGKLREGYSVDHSAALWKATTGEEVLSLPGSIACLLEDGKRVAVLKNGSTPQSSQVELFDSATGSAVRIMSGEIPVGVALHRGHEPNSVCAIDRQGELHHWNTQTGEKTFTLPVCPGPVKVVNNQYKYLNQSVHFSPNGRFVCVFPQDGVGQCFDLIERKATKLALGTLGGQGPNNFIPRNKSQAELEQLNIVGSVTFSPDSRWLLRHRLGSRPLLELCDPTTGDDYSTLDLAAEHWRSSYFQRFFNAIAFSPDGLQIACGTGTPSALQRNGHVGIFSVETGEELTHFSLDTDSVLRLAFAPDGRTLAVAGSSGRVELRDTKTAELQLALHHGSSEGALCLAFAADGTTLAVGNLPAGSLLSSRRMTYHLWDLKPRSPRSRVDGLSQLTYQAADAQAQLIDYTSWEFFQQNAPRIWFGSNSQQLHVALDRAPRDLWKKKGVNIADGKPIGPEQPYGRESADRTRRLDVVGRGPGAMPGTITPGKVRLVDVASDTAILERPEPDWLRAAGFSADGKSLALLTQTDHFLQLQGQPSQGFQLNVVRADNGQPIQAWRSAGSDLLATALSPRGGWVAATVRPVGRNNELRLWSTQTGQHRSLEHSFGQSPRNLRFSADETLLVAACVDHAVRVWDVKQAKLRWTLRGPPRPLTAIDFNANATRLFTATDDGSLQVWDLQFGQLMATFETGRPTFALAISPDNRWLASLDEASDVWLWDGGQSPNTAVRNYPRTVTELTRELAAAGESASLRRERGRTNLLELDYQAAAQDFAAALQLEPNDAETARLLATAATRAHRWDLVELAARAQVQANPKHAAAWLSLGDALARQGKLAEGATAFAQGEMLIHNNLEHKTTLAGLYAAAGDRVNYARVYEAAKKQATEWKWISKEHGNQARNVYLLAQMACYDPQPLESPIQIQAWASQALASQPQTPWHSHVLGMGQLRAGDFAAAEASFRASSQAVRGWQPGLNSLGIALAQLSSGAPAARQQALDALEDSNWVEQPPGNEPLLPSPVPLQDWLTVKLLRAEVSQRLASPTVVPKPSK
jgi:serine/threonine protein kinase/WD40 repeat protein